MSENGREPDLLILKAIWIIRTYPNLTVPQTMQAAGISMSNSKVPCLQMQVHCCISTAPPVSTTPPPSSIHAGPRSTEITAMISVTENISSTSTTEASINSNVKVPAPKPKQQRLNGVNKQSVQRGKKGTDTCFKGPQACHCLVCQRKSKREGWFVSIAAISKKVKEQFDGVGPSTRTIQTYVKDGLIDTSLKKKGANGNLPLFAFNTICTAFHSFVAIHQINGKSGELNRNRLRDRVNRVLRKDSRELSFKMLDRILVETAVELHSSKVNGVEERRILWTTYKNLKIWFGNWKLDLLNLGFVEQSDEGRY